MILLVSAIIAALLIIFFSENGELGWTLFILAALVCVEIFVDKRVSALDMYTYTRAHLSIVFGLAIVHILAGILWGLLKWKWYCANIYKYHNIRGNIIYASDNKARITGWMLWWELSLAWWLIHRPVQKLYTFIYDNLTKVLNSISENEKRKRFKNEAE